MIEAKYVAIVRDSRDHLSDCYCGVREAWAVVRRLVHFACSVARHNTLGMNEKESLASAPLDLSDPAVPVVLTTGTPFGGWEAAARALLGAAPQATDLISGALSAWCDSVLGDVESRAERGAVAWLDAAAAGTLPAAGPTLWGSVDARLVWAVDAVEAAWPWAQWIVFVESPAAVIAARLAAGKCADPAALLEGWCAGAEALLRLVRRAASRCVSIEACEAGHDPAAAAHLLQTRLGIRFGMPKMPTAAAPDPLALAVAEGLAGPNHRARALHAELLAACMPLGDPQVAIPAADAVVQRWVQLCKDSEQAARSTGELAQMRSELESRVTQCEQVQEELEFFHAELAELRRRPAGTGAAGAAPLVLGTVEVLSERDTVPYREVALRVDGVMIGDAAPKSMDLRLVEHHGRPGLVAFGDAGRSVLSGWSESAQEGGRGFMLLVPLDRNTHAAGRRLSATDWRLLLMLADRLSAELATSPSLMQPMFWSLSASRLRQQFDEVDWGLRLDAVTAAACSGTRAGSVELSIGGAMLGTRSVGALRLLLGPDRRLALAAANGQGLPPLPSWPHDGTGRPLEIWELPLGSAPGAARGADRWAGTTAADYAFVAALLGALPDLAARPEIESVLRAVSIGGFADQLPALAREARASRPGRVLKQRVAALLRALRLR